MSFFMVVFPRAQIWPTVQPLRKTLGESMSWPRWAEPNTAKLLGIEDFASDHELKMKAALRAWPFFNGAKFGFWTLRGEAGFGEHGVLLPQSLVNGILGVGVGRGAVL